MWIYHVSEISKVQSWLLKQTILDGYCVITSGMGAALSSHLLFAECVCKMYSVEHQVFICNNFTKYT